MSPNWFFLNCEPPRRHEHDMMWCHRRLWLHVARLRFTSSSSVATQTHDAQTYHSRRGEQREEVFLSLQAQSDNLGLTHDTWFKLSFHLATQMCRAEGGKMATREKTNSNQCRSHFSFRCRSFFFFFFHMQLPTHQFIFGNETALGKTPDAVISWVIFFWQSSHTDESATHRRVWLITKHTMELQGEVIIL